MGTPAAVKVGPGLLYIAPLGTAEPTSASGALPSAWIAIGYTDAGSEFSFGTKFEDVNVAEELDPVKVVATGRMTGAKFEMAEITARNLYIAQNGGTIASPVGASVKFEPPDLGAEVRHMLAWQADDAQELVLLRRVLQIGSIAVPRRKAPAKAVIPVEFRTEIPTDGSAIYAWFITSTLPYTTV